MAYQNIHGNSILESISFAEGYTEYEAKKFNLEMTQEEKEAMQKRIDDLRKKYEIENNKYYE